MKSRHGPGLSLAAQITRAASLQTYYTIRFLVDRGREEDAYQAYAYFRWVDDWLDQGLRPRAERLAFVRRQQALIESCLRGEAPADLTPQEGMLAHLLRQEPDRASGLHTYIRSMMAVMAFDAERRGRLVSQAELAEYTHELAVAVTEAMHYFIGHGCAAPHGPTRYTAVTGAHIAHMLRDTREDIAAGYFNLPAELAAGGKAPTDANDPAYREWAKQSVQKARACFKTGREVMATVENLRCRIAGFAYMRCFEWTLDAIERDGFALSANCSVKMGTARRLELLAWAVWMALRYRRAAAPAQPSALQIG